MTPLRDSLSRSPYARRKKWSESAQTESSETEQTPKAPARHSWKRTDEPEVQLPKWWHVGRGWRLPRNHRCKCEGCYGTGAFAYTEVLAGCTFCMQMEAACEAHRCHMCAGSGEVCPRCRGMRFLRTPPHLVNGQVRCEVRCDFCCEGNQVNVVKERREIEKYVARFGEE